MLIWALLACPVPEFSRLTERVLFGRRQTELREVSERKVRLMPPKLQVPLYSLVMQACLCLQVMFLLSLNSNSIRHPFLIRLYQEGLEPLSFFVPWTTSLGHLFLTVFHGWDAATQLFFLVCGVLLATAPPAWLLLSGLWLHLTDWGLATQVGAGNPIWSCGFSLRLETSILLKPVKRHMRGDSSVKLQ